LLIILDRLHLLQDGRMYVASLGLRPDPQSWVIVAGYIILSYLLGAALRPHVMRTAEYLTRPLVFLQARRRCQPTKDFMFPYRDQNKRTDVFPIICKRAEDIVGCQLDMLSRYEPFNTCKRILRVASPTLWEEVEYAEAESRMAASLFLASLSAVFLSLVPPSRWVIVAAPLAFILGRSFRRYREREAKYGYLNFVVATSPAIREYMVPPVQETTQNS
jgi:hypothetical protein